MTREEAIDFGEMWLDVNEDTKDSDTYMFIELATKALEQQPCDDAISRADVLNLLKGFEILHNHDELRTNLIYGVMSLPSVTPQPKIGHWIIDIKDGDYCICSECKHRFDVDHLKFSWDKYAFPPHCPNCGAKMEVEE